MKRNRRNFHHANADKIVNMMNDVSKLNVDANVVEMMRTLGVAAKAAARELARATTAAKNVALIYAANEMRAQSAAILSANANDVKRAADNGHDQAFIDRLTLTEKSICAMSDGVREVAALADPVGEMSDVANAGVLVSAKQNAAASSAFTAWRLNLVFIKFGLGGAEGCPKKVGERSRRNHGVLSFRC